MRGNTQSGLRYLGVGLLLAVALALSLAAPDSAQVRPSKGQEGRLKPAEATPCCSIVSIDGVTGTVTAKDKTTGQLVTFTVTDAALLQSLRMGQPVYVDQQTQKVSVDGISPCCQIVSGVGKPVGPAQFKPAGADACCAIVSIDGAAVTATAKNTTTGEVITFAVPDKSVLQGLQVGQAVYADTKTQKVSVDGVTPCCSLVTGVGAPKGPEQVHVAGASPCCSVVANPALKGRLGRVVVAFPAGANVGGTQVQVFKAGATEALKLGYGSQQIELLPGNYTVSISNKRVSGVKVKAGHDTQVRVGVVRINASGSTQGEVLDADRKTSLSMGYGNLSVGLPVGTYQLNIAGQTEPITVKEGKIAEF